MTRLPDLESLTRQVTKVPLTALASRYGMNILDFIVFLRRNQIVTEIQPTNMSKSAKEAPAPVINRHDLRTGCSKDQMAY